jgi:hypothetical protein
MAKKLALAPTGASGASSNAQPTFSNNLSQQLELNTNARIESANRVILKKACRHFLKNVPEFYRS